MNLSTRLADICDRAADLIETEGHTKGKAADPDTGALCLYGAIAHADRQLHGRINAVDTHLALNICASLGYTILWNDRPERTEYEVIDGLKHTAKALRNGEITLPETATA